MKILLKTILLFVIFQLIKLLIFFIEYYILKIYNFELDIFKINMNIIISKYSPVIIVFIILLYFSLLRKNKKNILPLIIAIILEIFILDKYLSIYFELFNYKVIINFILYAFLLILIVYTYKRLYNNYPLT